MRSSCSYDVKALFTSVPIQPALTIIEKLLEEDPGLQGKNINDSQEHHLSSENFALGVLTSPSKPILCTSPHPPLM